MNSSIKLSPPGVRDQVPFMADATNQQPARNAMMEWRVFLHMIETVCRAYGWEVEYDTPEGASCAIFADTVYGDSPADAWQQSPLLPESSV